ncbi:MAG: hypothetical protein IJK89_06525 [Clostridia bacterium]|nr:hypothetical protein [Clostridia bacterium]
MELDIDQIAVMAVAAIAEELQTDASNIRIVSFREVPRSALEQYVAERGISYKKYLLGAVTV